jgi:hypothetical protein
LIMASTTQIRATLTLEEFLRLPEIDEHPYHLLDEHIEYDELGELVNETNRPPDIHIEIVSRDQSERKCRERIVFSTANGCRLGWLIDAGDRVVQVFRPGQPPIEIASDGVLQGEPVLPGYRLRVAQPFGWLKRRKPNSPAAPSRSEPPLPESRPDEPGR